VSEGNVVFGFCGIKDVGEEIGIQITEERSANGKFTSFMNFLERMTGYVNKKNMESLIYSGAFDSVSNEQSPNRTSLAVNLDRALEYAKARSAVGESLFGEGANLFEEFKFDIVPELPKEEILNKENELCGFFFSGHPYDEMRDRIMEVGELNISLLTKELGNEEDDADFTYRENTVYTFAGKIVDFMPITTKKGENMAKITVEDFLGKIKVVFFPKVWEEQKGNISIGDYVGVHGTINFSDQGNGPEMVGLSLFPLDGSVSPKPNARRQVPQWIIDKNKPAEPPKPALPPAKKVHIMLRDGFLRDEELQPLRDTICEAANGRGEVLFHIDSINATFKAADCFKITYDDETIEKIQKSPYVEKVWLE
jgi:DNA polymerase-3 subunit alpha